MACIEFTVNGKKCFVNANLRRDTSLNAYLRYELQLPGTKAMCHEGGCGACIVSVRSLHPVTKEMRTFSVNSCLVLVFSCHGWDITTIEGVGSRHIGYHPIQKRMRSFNATQCGYCSPGWVMQMHSLMDKNLTMTELEKSFGSNTCRCTGYRPILDTMKSFAVDASPQLFKDIADIEELTKLHICGSGNKKCERKCSVRSDGSDCDWTVLEGPHYKESGNIIEIDFGVNKFYKVYNVSEIFEVLDKVGYSSYMLVAGNTGKGIVETFEYPRIIIDISDVKSLKEHEIDQNLVLGANMTLEDTKLLFEEVAATNYEFSYLSQFAKHFDLIAHIPVRKIGTLAGNLMLKHQIPSYPSDVFLLFESVGAIIIFESSQGNIESLSLTAFLERDVKNMIMIKIKLPPLSDTHIIRSYKIMPRHQNSLAIVNAAFVLELNETSKIIQQSSIVYGNISPTFVHAFKTETYLIGKSMDNSVLQEALNILGGEILPEENPPEESPECRKKLALGLFYKYILNISSIAKCLPSPLLRSGGQMIERPVSHGSQDFQSDQGLYPLNQAVPKLEAFIQSSGEAQYVNDLPNFPRQVFAAFVLSTIHVGELEKIESVEALEIDGVIAIYTAKDIPGINTFTHPGVPLEQENEELLAGDKIKFYGQPVAIVVAETEALAAQAAKQVKVTYKNISSFPPVLYIDEAKKDSRRLAPGDPKIEPKSKGNNVTKVIKGIYNIEAQYHYFMEPMTAVVIPVDDGLEVYSATQWLDLTQLAISDCLNMKESDVHVKLRRIGGGFGGKLSRSSQVSTACALVAKKMNLPCRFILPLQTNLSIIGKRLPCQTEYEVGVNDDGKIQYLNANIIEDNGCTHNENILDYAVDGFKNCYDSDAWNVKSSGVLTDLPSNTFARAPGTLEGISSIEHIMEHIAFVVQKDPTQVRLVNMREEDNDLPDLILKFKKDTDYDKRYSDIQQFNKMNRWMKKAITLSVMLFPVQFFGNYHAMVSIYRGDGTVTVTTGGVEMGQGINTKAAQVCAYTLDIPLNKISILPNYSFTAANDIFSGSSITSESVCFSIIKACNILKNRLKPIKEKLTNPTWNELIEKAGEEKIDLVASYMMTDEEPELQNYSAYTVTVLEVQLDVLLGRYEILRVDIMEDVGLSANPTVDVGQVEGGFVQGLGYYTSEKLRFDKETGKLLTNRSLNYHVPLALDIPADFRVKFRYNSKNPKGVLGSKAVGEMGICTSHSITHALRLCIYESRKDSGCDPLCWINIDIPYTTGSILKALDVKLNEFVITQ